MMFFLKKFLSLFFSPVVFVFLAQIVVAIIALKRKSGRFLSLSLIVIVGLYWLSGTSLVGKLLVAPLEMRYQAYRQSGDADSLRYIVVLGGGHQPEKELPQSDRLSAAALMRVVEGVIQQRNHRRSILILSGGDIFGQGAEAKTMANLAEALGVDRSSLRLEDQSLDTADQAVNIAAIVGGEPFLLVTSAIHLERSIRMFRRRGLHPVAAPTDFFSIGRVQSWWVELLPSSDGFLMSERACHEYLGLLWAWLRDQI